MVLARTPLLLEVFTAAVPAGLTHAGGPAVKGATTTANFRPVAANTGAWWGGRTWEGLLKKQHKKGSGRKTHRPDSPSMPIGGVVAGMKIARKLRAHSLGEAMVLQNVSGGNYANVSYNLPSTDHISDYFNWRHQCPNYDKIWHGSFCSRCDESAFRMPIGGAMWSRNGHDQDEDPIEAEAWPQLTGLIAPKTPAEVWRRIPK